MGKGISGISRNFLDFCSIFPAYTNNRFFECTNARVNECTTAPATACRAFVHSFTRVFEKKSCEIIAGEIEKRGAAWWSRPFRYWVGMN